MALAPAGGAARVVLWLDHLGIWQKKSGDVPALPARLNLEVPPDDLRRIRGIGPKIEAQCHQLGIYSYAQIAAWTAEDIAHIDVQLRGFEGRASRDDWVSEAKALMAESGQS